VPSQVIDAVKQFHDAIDIEIGLDKSTDFTHGDMILPNILLLLGLRPSVASITDWGQAGSYPGYWVHCKSMRVRVDPAHFDDYTQEQ
jgi:hypothetical protein